MGRRAAGYRTRADSRGRGTPVRPVWERPKQAHPIDGKANAKTYGGHTARIWAHVRAPVRFGPRRTACSKLAHGFGSRPGAAGAPRATPGSLIRPSRTVTIGGDTASLPMDPSLKDGPDSALRRRPLKRPQPESVRWDLSRMTWAATPRLWESTNALAIIADWKALQESALSEEALKDLRGHSRTGRPLGDETFMERLESAVGCAGDPRNAARHPNKGIKHGLVLAPFQSAGHLGHIH